MFVRWIVLHNFELKIAYAEYRLAKVATDPESIPAGFCACFSSQSQTGPGTGVSFIFGSNKSLRAFHKRHCFSIK